MTMLCDGEAASSVDLGHLRDSTWNFSRKDEYAQLIHLTASVTFFINSGFDYTISDGKKSS